MANGNFHRISEKSLPRLGIDDWHSKTIQTCNSAFLHRLSAFDIRQSSRNLRDECRLNAQFNTASNNARLETRIQELDRWYTEIRSGLNRLVREISCLRMEKNMTENDLDALNTSLFVVTESLSVRDCRLLDELTFDDVNVELKRELLNVENNMKLLRDQCQRAWEQLNRLNELKFKMNIELLHKDEARICDNQQRMSGEHFSNITFKTDPMRDPMDSCTYESWLENSKQIKNISDTEVESSCRLRESLFVAREKAKNSLRSQQELTDHVLRKRIFDTQCNRNELEWQIIKTKDEMKTMMKEINDLTNALEKNVKDIEFAETRLENRNQRPGMELCMDHVYSGLCDEVKQLYFAQQQLNEQSRISKKSYNELEANLLRLEAELRNKQHTLTTDIRAIDLRQRLKLSTEESTLGSRQITFTNVHQEGLSKSN